MTLFKPQEKVQFEKYMGNRTFDIFLEEKMALSQNNFVSHHILHIIIWLNFFYQIFLTHVYLYPGCQFQCPFSM